MFFGVVFFFRNLILYSEFKFYVVLFVSWIQLVSRAVDDAVKISRANIELKVCWLEQGNSLDNMEYYKCLNVLSFISNYGAMHARECEASPRKPSLSATLMTVI